MRPDEAFVQRLKNYDPRLGVRWVANSPLTGKPINRWEIIRYGDDSKPRHIMFVTEKDGSYRPLDNRILERLHKCDSHRYNDMESLMAALDIEPDEQSGRRTALKNIHDRRYHDWVEELGDKLAYLQRQTDAPTMTKEEELIAGERAEQREACERAERNSKGTIVWDPRLQGPRLLSEHG